MILSKLGTKLTSILPDLNSIYQYIMPKIIGKSVFEAKIIKKAVREMPFATQLANAQTETEITNLVKHFTKQNREALLKNPKIHNEICTIVQNRIASVRAKTAFVG